MNSASPDPTDGTVTDATPDLAAFRQTFRRHAAGVAIVNQLLLVAAMCLGSAWLGRMLFEAERAVA